MLRDRLGQPLGDGLIHHGTDVETHWGTDVVPDLTPNDRFFVRNHTRPAVVDASSWRLLVTGDGLIGDATYSLADLQAFTSQTYERALECTGNGRRYFAEQQRSVSRRGCRWWRRARGRPAACRSSPST